MEERGSAGLAQSCCLVKWPKMSSRTVGHNMSFLLIQGAGMLWKETGSMATLIYSCRFFPRIPHPQLHPETETLQTSARGFWLL